VYFAYNLMILSCNHITALFIKTSEDYCRILILSIFILYENGNITFSNLKYMLIPFDNETFLRLIKNLKRNFIKIVDNKSSKIKIHRQRTCFITDNIISHENFIICFHLIKHLSEVYICTKYHRIYIDFM